MSRTGTLVKKPKDFNMKYSGEYQYIGLWGCDCVCYLEIDGNTVIVTELPQNRGTSITNFAEHLATQVCNEFKIPKNSLIWIEHYPANRLRPAIWDLVTFKRVEEVFKSPQWRPLSETEKRAGLPTRGVA